MGGELEFSNVLVHFVKSNVIPSLCLKSGLSQICEATPFLEISELDHSWMDPKFKMSWKKRILVSKWLFYVVQKGLQINFTL